MSVKTMCYTIRHWRFEDGLRRLYADMTWAGVEGDFDTYEEAKACEDELAAAAPLVVHTGRDGGEPTLAFDRFEVVLRYRDDPPEKYVSIWPWVETLDLHPDVRKAWNRANEEVLDYARSLSRGKAGWFEFDESHIVSQAFFAECGPGWREWLCEAGAE